MTIQPVNVYIPPLIEAGINMGELFRNGSVVRNALGQIVAHLDEVPDTSEMVEKVADAAARMKWIPSKRVIIIASAVAVTAALVTGGVVHTVKKQAQRKMAMPECVSNFGASWDRYQDAIRERRLDVEIIDKLISDFDVVRQYSEEHGSRTLDLSTEQGKSLVNFVADYTSKLADANSVDLSELREQAQAQEPGQPQAAASDAVVDMRRNLAVQRKIFGDAADAEPTFSDRIEAEIHKGGIDSPAAEEAAQLERWMTHGAPTPGTPARRFKDKAEE